MPSTTEDVNLDFSEDNGSHDAPHVRSPSSDISSRAPQPSLSAWILRARRSLLERRLQSLF